MAKRAKRASDDETLPPRVDFGNFNIARPLPIVGGQGDAAVPKTHPLVPQPPFMWNVVGPTGSGKTTMVVHLLLGPYRHLFDKIYYIVPTFKTDKNWRLIDADDDKILPYDPAVLQEFHEKVAQKAEECRESGEPIPSVLLVLDDTAGKQASSSRMGPLDAIFATDRKHNVSVINMAQKYKSQIPTTARWNATHTSIFRLQSGDEVADLAKELRPPDLTFKQFMSMYNQAATARIGSFLHISRFSPTGTRFSIGFNQVFAI